MKTEETKIYEFSELSEESKEHAIDKMRLFNVEHIDWWDYTVDDFKENQKYFEADKVCFSGFCSQGDGAMFEYYQIKNKLVNEFVDHTCSVHNISETKREILEKYLVGWGSGEHKGRYNHENCCDHDILIEVDDSMNPDLFPNVVRWIESFQHEFEEYVVNLYKDICRELYATLEKEYDYLTSDDSIVESIECNEYEFNEDGGLY